LTKCVCAGEASPDATRSLFRQATGIEIVDGIGSTEMIHIFISHAPEKARRGATGYAVPGYRATVLDDEGKACRAGTVGRLAVKGPTGCRYLADERQPARPGARAAADGLREKQHRAVQVSARGGVRRRLAAHRDRQAAALQAEAMTMQILQPPGWARPKGFSNGISCQGRLVFIGG